MSVIRERELESSGIHGALRAFPLGNPEISNDLKPEFLIAADSRDQQGLDPALLGCLLAAHYVGKVKTKIDDIVRGEMIDGHNLVPAAIELAKRLAEELFEVNPVAELPKVWPAADFGIVFHWQLDEFELHVHSTAKPQVPARAHFVVGRKAQPSFDVNSGQEISVRLRELHGG